MKQSPWIDVEQAIEQRDSKRAEASIARHLRGTLSDSERASLLFMRAKTRLLTNRSDEALEDLTFIQTIDTTISSTTYFQEVFADSYLQRFEQASVGFADKNDVKKALVIYHELLNSHQDYTNSGWLFYQLGRVYLATAQPEVADDYFRRAIFSPSDVKSLVGFCFERLAFIAHYDMRKPQMALTYITKAIQTVDIHLNPFWTTQTYLLRSRILQDINLSEAIESAYVTIEFAKALPAQNARNLQQEAYFMCAELLSRAKGNEREVVENIQQFLQLGKPPISVDVTWSRVYEMLGNAYEILQKYEQAIEAYLACLQFNPYHPWEASIQFRIASSYYNMELFQKSLASLIELESNTDRPQASSFYQLLGDVYKALGRKSDAEQAYSQATNIQGENHES